MIILSTVADLIARATSQSELSNIIESDKFQFYSVMSYGATADGSDDSEAIQDAIDAIHTAGGGILVLADTHMIGNTIYLANDVTLLGKGHQFGTLLYAGTSFYTSTSNFTVDGYPVMIVASVDGTEPTSDSFTYSQASHVNICNLSIYSQAYSAYTAASATDKVKNAYAIYGKFYESNFENISVLGFLKGADIELNNSKIQGASYFYYNKIAFDLNASTGALISQMSTVNNTTDYKLSDLSEGVTFNALHSESGKTFMRIGERCKNIAIISPHLLNYETWPFIIHPSSEVAFIGSNFGGNQTQDVYYQSPIHNSAKFCFNQELLYRYDNTSDGEMLLDGEGAYTATNCTIEKKEGYNLNSNSKFINNGKRTLAVTGISASNKIETSLTELGFLDFEFVSQEAQRLKITILDSAVATVYTSGYVSGTGGSASINTIPIKVTGYVDETGFTGPFILRVEAEATTSYIINKLAVYKSARFYRESGTGTLTADGGSYLGFASYTFAGVATANIRFELPAALKTTKSTKIKLCFWAKALTDDNVIYARDNADTAKTSQIFLPYNEWVYCEISTTSTVYCNIFKSTANSIQIAGAGYFYYKPDNKVQSLPAMPTAGYWVAGDRVINTNRSEAGAGGSKYVVTEWQRIVTGSNNVLNTDWLELRSLTGN